MSDTPLKQRIRGQEVEVRVIKDSVLLDTITKITDFEVELMLDIQQSDFLGEIVQRKDEIYNGVKYNFTMQLDSGSWLDQQLAIKKRAQRITPDVQFVIVSTLYFPSGETRVIVIPDAKFGAQPLNVGSRKDYVTLKCEGEADDYDLQAA